MRKLLALSCALLLALVAVGCGSSGGSEEGGGDTTTTEASATTTEAEVTTTEADGDDEPAEGDEADYLAAIQTSLTSGSEEGGDLVLADGEGECVAPVWLDIITVDALIAAGASPEDVEDPDFDFQELELDEEQAQGVIDAFEPCGVDIYAKLGQSLTESLSEEQQTCAMDEIDTELGNALLLTAFSTTAGTGEAEFGALIDQLTEACDLPAS